MSGTLAGLSSLTNANPTSSNPIPVTTPMKFHEPRYPTDSRDQEKARWQIDQEIQKFEDSIRALRSRRNILASISRLPPELLTKIFSFRVTECAEGNHPLEWIKVSHVSRHWRAVALDSPSLWGNLVFSHPKWSEEMLKRSKMANLIIKADLTCITPKIFDAVRQALLHGPRIHELELFASGAPIERLLADVSFEAPMLRSLSLSVPLYTQFGTDEGITLPGNVLRGEMPYLRKVELMKCNLNWNSPLLCGLTHLKIYDISAAARPTTQQLIDALERMPALEVLDLQKALPRIEGSLIPPVDHIIDLPRLSHISIKSSVPECVNLVRRITIPPAARIHLSCSGTETTGDDFSGVLQFLSDTNSSCGLEGTDGVPERKVIQTLHIRHETPSSLVINGWTEPFIPKERHERPSYNTADIQLHLSWHSSTSLNLDIITGAVCKAIPLTQLRSLYLCHLADISQHTWVSAFGTLSKLHNVHIMGNSAHTFLAALREERVIESPISNPSPTSLGFSKSRRPAIRRRKSAAPVVYFPHLRTLTLEDANFEGVVPLAMPFKDLLDCLMERCERKAEIQKLCLVECSHLDETDVELLKEIVVDVDWDGVELGFTDDDDDSEDYGSFGVYYDSDYYDSDLDG